MGIDSESLALTCSCRADWQAKLAEHYAALNPDASNIRADLMGYAFGAGQTLNLVEMGAMEVQYTGEWKLKSGAVKPRTYKARMFFAYCPFCGRKAGVQAPVTYEVQSVQYLAGELRLKTIDDAEVPQSIEAGMRVELRKGGE
jgi:hypothetical protein